MFLRFPRVPALGAAVVLLAIAAPLGAQLTEGILSPAGRLRLEVTNSFDIWSNRFGSRTEGGSLVEGVEPLGFDLDRFPIPVASLEQGLRSALGQPSLSLDVGSARAVVARDRTRVAFGAALGVFDWLTLGASVPIVKARTEVAFDYRAGPDTDVGANPRLSDGSVSGFLNELAAGRTQLRAQVLQRCPAQPDCAALTDLLARYTTFSDGLTSAYNSSAVFVTAASAEGVALQQRLTALRTEVGQRAPGVSVPNTAPMPTAVLDQQALERLLTDPAAGFALLQPFRLLPEVWTLGDVEVSVAVRVLEIARRDSAAAPARFRALVGVQGLARLPTGKVDDPNIPLDFGTGDAQLDLEGGAFTDLRWTRIGVRAEGRYGVQRETDLLRRVAPPDVVFAPLTTGRVVRWTPGSYLSFEAAPSWYLADEFAVGGTYRLWSKGADEYAYGSGPLPDDDGNPDPSVLAAETEETLHEVGLGLAFSTLTSWREGRASVPFEVRLAVRRAIAGSGGAVPKGTRMEATGRVFWRLWGAEPELVR